MRVKVLEKKINGAIFPVALVARPFSNFPKSKNIAKASAQVKGEITVCFCYDNLITFRKLN
jgi:hypothetical protein